MATLPSNNYVAELNLGNIAWGTDTNHLILMNTGFTFDEDTHDNYSDVSANELPAGNGYTSGGNTLTTVVSTRDDANNRVDVTADDTTWNASGGTIGPAAGAMWLKWTGTASTSTVIGYIDFGGDQSAPDGAPFIVRNLIVRGLTVPT